MLKRHYLVYAAIASLCSGCTAIQRLTNRDGLTNAERDKIRNEERLENERIAQLKENIHPGMTSEEIKSLWGAPEEIDFIDGHYIYTYYDDGPNPLKMYLKDGKLAGWSHDRELGANIRQERYTRRSVRAQESQAHSSRIQAFSSLQSSSAQQQQADAMQDMVHSIKTK